jgi:NitT/TauT family transport system substrate-binding protein
MIYRMLRFAVAMLLAVGVLTGAAYPVRSQTTAHLRIMTSPIENGAQVYYAKDMGFFAKAGIDVDIQSVQSGSAIASGVASNATDIGFASLVPLAIAHVKKIPFVLVAAGAVWTQSAKNSGLFVAPNSPLQTGKDFNGKTLSTAGLGTLTEYATRAWIDQHGGDQSTVKFVEMGYSVMPTALGTGRVDGALMNEPYFSLAKKTEHLLGYPYDAVAKDFLIAGWFTTAQWAKDNPDVLDRFVAVMRETAQWANKKENQAQSAEILEKYTPADATVVSSMVRVRFGEQLVASAVQPQVDVAAKYMPFPTFPAQELIYTRAR